MSAQEREAYGKRPKLSTNRSQLRLDAGEVYGAPDEYFNFFGFENGNYPNQQMKNYVEAGLRYPENGTETARNFIRERFDLGNNPENPYVFLNQGGSEGILERIPRLIFKCGYKTQLYGVSPHFPEIVRFIDQYPQTKNAYIKYTPVQANLYTSPDEVMAMAMEQIYKYSKTARRKNEQVVLYDCNPGTPGGGVKSKETLRYVADLCDENDILFIEDEAFGDALPDDESLASLAKDRKKFIVLRSLSKTVGLAGLRYGYAVMSADVGEIYQELQNPYEISGQDEELMNKMFDNGILIPHLEQKRKEMERSKVALLKALDKRNIKYLPTDSRVPILTIDCGVEANLVSRLANLGVASIGSEGFKDTHEELMTNRFARIAVPRMISERQMEDIAQRIWGAVQAARGYLTP